MSTGLTFNAIDVETANADRASICQIGIVHVHDGNIRDEWKTLLDPEDWFDSWNVAIHGIDERAVRGAPTLPQVRDELRRRLRDSVLVSHTVFDRTAFERAMNRYELEQLQVTWLDSASIVRHVWPARYASRGWGLKKVARDLKIAFTPHDALEDARAAAQVVCHASAASGLDVEALLQRVQQPIIARTTAGIGNREGNAEGQLYGETIVFTGTLSVPREQVVDWAVKAGCNVGGSVTRKTTILVVGLQDMARLRGYEKSSKHRKAEELIGGGQDLRILSENDFIEILRLEDACGASTSSAPTTG